MAPATASLVSGLSDLHQTAGVLRAPSTLPQRQATHGAVAAEHDASAGRSGLIFIRRSKLIDTPRLRELAALNSIDLPDGRFLVAEVGGEVVAAVSVDGSSRAFGRSSSAGDDVRRFFDRLVSS